MLFSVIIPLYNKAPYIEKALRSVFAQTCADYELVVVDDGSKDDSASIAEKCMNGFWQGKTQPVKLIKQTNAGVSMARNNGVAASHGEYVCFLDADDWWEPTFLEEIAKLIEGYPDAGIYGTGYTIVNETKHKTRIAPIGVETGYIDYCRVYARNLCMPLTSISVAVPRRVFDEMHGFRPQLKLGEDFDLWIRIALKCRVAFLNKPLANYNQDVDVANRGVGHLHKPENHMLWNLGYLEEEEKTNPDYKQLIDDLRVYGLLNHYLSEEYHEAAKSELAKVDWNRQPKKWRRLYGKPIACLRLRRKLLAAGSLVKRKLAGILKK